MILKVLLGIVLTQHTLAFSASRFFSTPSRLYESKQISWPEYKANFIDPIVVDRSNSDSHLEGHMDPYKRKVSDQYWLAQFEDDKEKLHQLNLDAGAVNSNTPAMEDTASKTSFETYKNNNLDPMKSSQKSQNILKGHMDPKKRAESDEFWLHTFLEEKQRLHGKKSSP